MQLICGTHHHRMVWMLRAEGSKSDQINSEKIEKSLESVIAIATSHSRGFMPWITVSVSVPGKYHFDLALVLFSYIGICDRPLSKTIQKQAKVFALQRARKFTDASSAVRSLKFKKHSCHLASFYI